MSRARTLKPGFFRNPELSTVSPLTRIFFQGLWCECDRRGIVEDRPKKLKVDILPYDKANVEQMLENLASLGFIERYEVDGVRCIHVVNFERHQNPHRDEKASTLPAPCQHSVSTVATPDETGSGTALTLNPITSSLPPSPPSPPKPSNGRADAAAAESYCSVIGESTCTKVAEQFRQVDESLSPGWFTGMLRTAESQCGPAQRPQLKEAVKVTLSEVERRLAAEKNGGGVPVVSVKKFTEAVFVRNLSDALGVGT